jgi:hypothetical protein
VNKVLLGLGVALAVLVAAILLRGGVEHRDGEPAPESSGDRAIKAKYSGLRLPSDAVLAIAPGGRPSAQAVNDAKVTPLMREMMRERGFKAIHDRLAAKSATRTPEENWALAQILERCATITEDKVYKGPRFAMGGEGSREKFVAALSDKDPNRALRLAAFERINGDACDGLAGLEVSRKDLRAMREAAADAGDPKARAELVRMTIDEQLRGPDGRWSGKIPTISDEQVAVLKEVFASQDPQAMLTAAQLLARSMQNFSLRAGGNQLPIDFSAFNGAATLAACAYGYDCGPDSRQLQMVCALQGRCAASDYREFLYYYANSPATSQLLGEYESALRRAASERDWSYFTFHPGPAPTIAAFVTK